MKTILVSIAGLSPQIITETLYYYLIERKPPIWINEVKVLTTYPGKQKIMETLLDKNNGKFYSFCKDYNINPKNIKFDESSVLVLGGDAPIEDIISDKDSAVTGNEIVKFTKEISMIPDSNCIYSIAGGRKTMTAYLSLAAQLYGKDDDVLSHTLVSPDFESNRDFYYIPPENKEMEVKDAFGNIIKTLNTKDAKIYSSEIVFLKLRKFLNTKDDLFYDDLVGIAQKRIDFCGDKIVAFDIKNASVLLGSKKVKLRPLEICIYYLFYYFKIKCKNDFCGDCTDCYLSVNDLSSYDNIKIILNVYEKIYSKNSGQFERLSESFKNQNKGDEFFMQNVSNINKKLKKHLNAFEYAVYRISKTGNYGKRYGIFVDKRNVKRETLYG
jgi:CRISPR-associated protein Csx14